MRKLLATYNVLDWLALYQPALAPLSAQGLRFEKLYLSPRSNDPMPFRIQVTYDSRDLGRVVSGYGEGTSELSAYEKALCELFEREALYRHGARLGLATTNGVAAHRIRPLATQSAKRELIERDAFLRHWLTRTPLLQVQIRPDTLSAKFASSLRGNGYRLLMCETYLGVTATSVAIVVDPATGGFMMGSSAAAGEASRQRKAIGEAFIGLFSDLDKTIDPSFRQFKDHSNHWFFERKIPEWLVGSERLPLPRPPRPAFNYHVLATDPVPVVAAVSDQLIPLWTGPTPESVVQLCQSLYKVEINTDIHPFP